MTEPLHLVRLLLDRRELARAARGGRSLDEGYLFHAGLSRLFATSAAPSSSLVQPFAHDDLMARSQDRPGTVYLLGYSSLSGAELVARMGPAREGLLQQVSSREVPVMAAGTLCSFRTRICPVVRTRHPGEHGERLDNKGRRVSREVDAWLVHRFKDWQASPPRDQQPPIDTWADRAKVYGEWLARELSAVRADARPSILEAPAELLGVEMVELFREPFRRKGEARLAPGPERGRAEHPNAVLEGTLRVRDAAAFRALLARGVGRHRAFGFGMLLVRPG
jgi:CRISPR system Cascade subunit CasE